MESFDVFAETNPAFCSVILQKFCLGYSQESDCGVDFPIIFLVLPIVLSSESNRNFLNTNVATGLFRWLDRNPEVLVQLPDLVQETVSYTKRAITFGLSKKAFGVSKNGQFVVEHKEVFKNTSSLDPYIKMTCINSFRFGQWLGQVGSTTMIYNSLGLAYE